MLLIQPVFAEEDQPPPLKRICRDRVNYIHTLIHTYTHTHTHSHSTGTPLHKHVLQVRNTQPNEPGDSSYRQGHGVTLLTWNVCDNEMSQAGPRGWTSGSQRQAQVDLILSHRPDLVCLQVGLILLVSTAGGVRRNTTHFDRLYYIHGSHCDAWGQIHVITWTYGMGIAVVILWMYAIMNGSYIRTCEGMIAMLRVGVALLVQIG